MGQSKGYIDVPLTPRQRQSAPPVDDDASFRSWYAGMAKRHNLAADPDAPEQLYDYRAAFRAGVAPDASGHWPSQFKKPGHPNEIVGGFNTRTGQRAPGAPRASEQELVGLGWDPATAKALAATPEGGSFEEPADFEDVPLEPALSRAPLHPPLYQAAASVNNFARGVGNAVRQIPTGIAQMVTDPVGTVRGVGEAQAHVGLQAKEAFDRGDYFRATIKGVEYLIPILGPIMSAAGDKMEQGDIAEAAGELATNTVLMRLPAVGGRVTARPGKILPAAQTAEEAAAVEFGRQRGVPIDAATATGNRYVAGVQATADTSPLGSVVAGRARQQQQQAMRRVAGDLKDEASPTATDPVVAGERVTTALEQQIRQHHANATDAYARLRQFEERADPDLVWLKGQADGMQLAIDLTRPRSALRPIFDRLMKKKELTGQLMGAEGRAAVALDALITGPDFAPLSVVDAALSDLKALARSADLSELRTTGQGIAAEAVKQLDARVRARAAQAGPDVLKALEEGRAATKAKYVTADVREMVSGSSEPRAIFNRLTANEDAGIAKLRELRRVAPQELPTVARAVLEDILAKPLEEGGFAHGQRAWADWQRLGSGTKQLLFPKAGQAQALDSFFLLAKKLSESPNPSGTSLVANSTGQTVLAFTNPMTGVPIVLGSAALSKILHNPTAVNFLTRGMRVSLDAKPGAQFMAAAQLTRAANEAGVVIRFPKAAERESTAPPHRPR